MVNSFSKDHKRDIHENQAVKNYYFGSVVGTTEPIAPARSTFSFCCAAAKSWAISSALRKNSRAASLFFRS